MTENNRVAEAIEAEETPDHPILFDRVALHLPAGFEKRETWADGKRFVMRQVNEREFRLEAEV